MKEKITLKNSLHNTEITVDIEFCNGIGYMTKSLVDKVVDHLCGKDNCPCPGATKDVAVNPFEMWPCPGGIVAISHVCEKTEESYD